MLVPLYPVVQKLYCQVSCLFEQVKSENEIYDLLYLFDIDEKNLPSDGLSSKVQVP